MYIADWAIAWITNGLFWCVVPLIYIFSSLRVLDLCIPPLQVTLYVLAPQSVHSTGNLLVLLKCTVAYWPKPLLPILKVRVTH